jgi:hypothetical protein
MFDAVRTSGVFGSGSDDGPELLLSIDSTVVRAHQHAAGARRLLPVVEDAVESSVDTGGSSELHEFAGRAG